MDRQVEIALNKTIKAYRLLIDNVEKYKGKWRYFGNFEECHLCIACGLDVVEHITHKECRKCAFWEFRLCIDKPCMDQTFSDLQKAIDKDDDKKILQFAKQRLRKILKHIKRI